MALPTALPIRHHVVDHMRVETFSSCEALGLASARAIGDELRSRLAAQNAVRMVFAAAPSQASMLRALRNETGIDWRRVIALHMDEYIGLAPNAPERFAAWLGEHLFSHFPFAATHKIIPEPDPDAEAQRYSALLAQAPVDIACLGIGVNGPIAFNDPPVADCEDPLDVKIVLLDEACRQQVDDMYFALFDDVPERAITLTVPRLLRAERMFCVVPGALKRNAVRKALSGPVETSCPASIFRTHPGCVLYLDAESDPNAEHDRF